MYVYVAEFNGNEPVEYIIMYMNECFDEFTEMLIFENT